MHSVQVRMARAALGLTAAELAKSANITRATVEYFERKNSAKHSTVMAMQRALESSGCVFVDGAGGPGVRIREKIPA